LFYWLFYEWLGGADKADSVFRIFSFISFRTAMATLTALLLSLALSPMFIRWLRARQIGQVIRPVGLENHEVKAGTPTMGGIMVLLCLTVSILLWGRLTNSFLWLALLLTLGFGVVGWLDDWLKVSKKDAHGLKGRWKLAGQFGIGLVILLLAYQVFDLKPILAFPFIFYQAGAEGADITTPLILSLGFLIPFGLIVVVGSSNAVNLTDGLDGLATGPVLTTTATFTIFCYVAGNAKIAAYLGIPFEPMAGELTVFCGALFGCCLGFLWYNTYPASIFLGDVGSLSLGGALGIMAVLTHNELLIVILGGLFVFEALSVIIQVTSYKLFKKRVFPIAPFHHTLERMGWKETQVVVRLWIISVILALIALATLKLRFNIPGLGG
jgi:phospho-N-acetylmuramoyl-pentapeptide-transferase